MIAEMVDVLRILDLEGVAPAEFVTIEVEVSEHGTYIHNQGGDDEWSLTWTKVDDASADAEH